MNRLLTPPATRDDECRCSLTPPHIPEEHDLVAGLGAGGAGASHDAAPEEEPAPEAPPWLDAEDDYGREWEPQEEEPPGPAPDAAKDIMEGLALDYGIEGPAAERMAIDVASRIGSMRVGELAKRMVRQAALVKDADLDNVEVITAAELLARPRPPRVHVFGELMAEGHNATVVARWKVGKSTLVDNMAAAGVRGGFFLDRFKVPAPMRVVLFNYELEPEDMADRLVSLALDAEERERLEVINLRGRRLPLTTPVGRERVARWLGDHGAQVMIVDPFGAAYAAAGGESENDNAEVRRFLIGLDEIKRLSGCRTLVMPVHTGRGEAIEGDEQGRGATVLEDWPDVRMVLTKDAEERRFLRTEGRAWNLRESPLDYEEELRHLSLAEGKVGMGRRAMARSGAQVALVAALAERPGLNSREMRTVAGDLGVANNSDRDTAVSEARRAGLLHTHPGKGNAVLHYAGPAHGLAEACPEGWQG